MHNNTRSKAILKVLSGKTRSANEERRQLRRAAVIYKHGEGANVNAILAAEDRLMKMEEENAKRRPNNKNNSRKANKHNNKPNNKPKNKANNNTKKAPKKWATVKTLPVRR